MNSNHSNLNFNLAIKRKCEENSIFLIKKSADGIEKTNFCYRKCGIKLFFKEAFLPIDYPHSVSSDYTQYQLWDTAQAFFSTLSGMLAVESVLEGIGVGKANATPLAAAMAWFTKDGVGRVTGIFFAWSRGTYLDMDCKKWRLFADGLNDLALSLELSLSLFPANYVVFLLSMTCAMKAIVGVAGSSTRGALTHHQAIRGNTADLCAKDGSQETVVNLIATVLGLAFLGTEFVQRCVWPLMILFILSHLYSNYRAVKSIRLKKFNTERLLIAFQEFLATDAIPSVDFVNLEESVIPFYYFSSKSLCGYDVRLGDIPHNFDNFNGFSDGRKYFLSTNDVNKTISVTLSCDSGIIDEVQGYFHALVLGLTLHSEVTADLPFNCLANRINEFRKNENKIATCDENIQREWNTFYEASNQQGWKVEESLLYDYGFRAELTV